MQSPAQPGNADMRQPVQQISQTPIPTHMREAQPPPRFTFGLYATMPPQIEPQQSVQRLDEVRSILGMLTQRETSAVILLGKPGAGKSTLAALLYQQIATTQQSSGPSPRYLVWLTLDTYTTLPALLAALLSGIQVNEPGFFLFKPEQQISTLLRALRRTQAHAFIIFDHFELLLQAEQQEEAEQNMLALFMEMLHNDLGASRILFTSTVSPYKQEQPTARVRSYLVSHISTQDGVMLLQQRAVQGQPELLAQVWQRCAGHVFSLVLLHALLYLSDTSLSYLLDAPEYQGLWSNDVTLNLIAAVYRHLTPLQYALMRVLSLFHEPIPLFGLVLTIMGQDAMEAQGQERSQAIFSQGLNTLTQVALVQTLVSETGSTCYSIHPLLRAYILEHFLEGNDQKESSDLQATIAAGHMQVVTYYRSQAQQLVPPREQRTSVQDVTPLIWQVRHLCLAGQKQQACNLLFSEGLHERMVRWGSLHTLLGLYKTLLMVKSPLQANDEGLMLSYLGMLYGRIGMYQQSQGCYEQALMLQRQLGDTRAEAITLTNQGEIWRLAGDLERARANFERALTLEQQLQDPQLRCVLLHDVGLLYHNAQQYDTAREYYIFSLRLASSVQQDTDGKSNIAADMGMILTNLGMLLYEQKQRHEAIALLITAIQLRRAQHDPTVNILERFLAALEQRMGTEAYTALCQSALAIQQQLLLQLMTE